MKKDSPLWQKSLVIIGIFILVLTIVYVLSIASDFRILSGRQEGSVTLKGAPENMIYFGLCFNTLLTIIFGYNIYLNTKK